LTSLFSFPLFLLIETTLFFLGSLLLSKESFFFFTLFPQEFLLLLQSSKRFGDLLLGRGSLNGGFRSRGGFFFLGLGLGGLSLLSRSGGLLLGSLYRDKK
jgi:hypothetical protein